MEFSEQIVALKQDLPKGFGIMLSAEYDFDHIHDHQLVDVISDILKETKMVWTKDRYKITDMS